MHVRSIYMRRKPLLILAGAVAAIVGLPIAWYLGSPLFINRSVDESFPVAQAAALPAAATSMPFDATAQTIREQATAMEQPVVAGTQQPMETVLPPTLAMDPTREPT